MSSWELSCNVNANLTAILCLIDGKKLANACISSKFVEPQCMISACLFSSPYRSIICKTAHAQGKYWAPLNCYPMCACPDGIKQCLCVPMYVCQPAKCFKQAFTDLILKAKQIILGHSVPKTNACHYFSSSLFKFIGFLTPPLLKSHVIVNSCHVLPHPSYTHTHTLQGILST